MVPRSACPLPCPSLPSCVCAPTSPSRPRVPGDGCFGRDGVAALIRLGVWATWTPIPCARGICKRPRIYVREYTHLYVWLCVHILPGDGRRAERRLRVPEDPYFSARVFRVDAVPCHQDLSGALAAVGAAHLFRFPFPPLSPFLPSLFVPRTWLPPITSLPVPFLPHSSFPLSLVVFS